MMASRFRHWFQLSLILLATASGGGWSARCSAFDAQPQSTLQILPAQPALSGPHATQRLVVEEVRDGQFFGDLSADAKFVSLNPEIATVDPTGIVSPVADGTATIRAELGGRSIETQVIVKGAQTPEPWSFRHDVQSVFTRTGCNMGSCHGAQAGKKGFKLALRGYDHEMDYNTLTRQAKGRRVSLSDPARSLILLKATGVIPHGGATRFDDDSLEYRIVSEWIAEGAPAPRDSDPAVVSLDIFPKQVTLAPQRRQQMLVQATYSDGRRRDVTHWAKYTSTEVGVSAVDDEGLITVAGHGEAAITVWFASKVALATISVPYEKEVRVEVYANSPRHNFVDGLVLDKLQRLRIPPGGMATDAEFMRRAFLDTLGVLPGVEEAQLYLADQSADKRPRLIESLLARPEYVDYWSYKWSDLLLVSTKKLKGPAVWSFSNWIRQAVAANKPWNEFAREVITARGSTIDNGAANYFVLHKDAKLLNEATTLTFLGLSIGCAQCHDHPLERWTLDDYYGMANLFARIRTKDGATEGESIVFPVSDGDIKHPTRQAKPTPRPLDGIALANDDPRDRREHLAQWLTAPENPYFGKALANRVWANYMGRGLVEKVDDLRATNPPSNEVLLEALARDFVAHGYDVKHLIRTIMNSAAYQRSPQATPENAADDRFYSHYLVKRMSAEVMLDALSQVTAVATDFPDYPSGLRALQLPDNNVASYFLSAFGRPAREFTCECERSEEPSITQTLHLANGKTLNEKLKVADNVVKQWIDRNLSAADVIDRIYLGALTRYPAPDEKEKLVAALTEAMQVEGDEAAKLAARREAIEDLLWAVLTSKEFLFVH
ncbi:MAG: DUF1553 domain-containing protein [Planctomycetaceae bacterium]|nr:DUF1553 domain-containing protein [Planctomycetaceae bacterium]